MKTLTSFGERLARLQQRRPLWILAAVIALTAAAAALAFGLKLDSSYYALVPQDAPEVRDANDVRERTGGNRLLVIAIEGDDSAARLEFGRRLSDRLGELEHVRWATLEFPVEFFEDRAFWLMDLDRLDRVTVALEAAVRRARAYANPLVVRIDEERDLRRLEESWAQVEEVATEGRDRLLDGVLTSSDGHFTFIIVNPWVRVMDVEGTRAMFQGIDALVDELEPDRYGATVRYAGKFTIMRDLHKTLSTDLRNASFIALVLSVLLVAVFTRQITAPLIIGVALLVGTTWTLALARLLVGQLNVITGFLVAVLVGLGVDFGIHLVVRYQQERRLAGLSSADALTRAVSGTLPPALTCALTTSGAFFAFLIADFRGFSEFGLIAGVGVLVMMVASFLVIPVLLVLVSGGSRLRGPLTPNPSPGGRGGQDRRRGGPLTPNPSPRRRGGPTRGLRVFTAGVVVAAFLGVAVYGAMSAENLKFINDFKLLRGESEAQEFFDYVDENLAFRFDPTVVLVETANDAMLVESLARQVSAERQRESVPSNLGNVFSAANVLPVDAMERSRQIESLRELLLDHRLDRALERGGEQAEKLATARRMILTEPWRIDAIPSQYEHMLRTLDDSELVVFIWPTSPIESDIQALAWEEELGELQQLLDRNGIVYTLSTETVMPAWVHRMIVSDLLPLLLLTSIVVLALVVVQFRRLRSVVVVAGCIAVGTLALIAGMRLMNVDVNMFNLIVIPCVIGIGIDDIIHIYYRYREQGGSMRFVLRSTGVAALLTTLTTQVGFGSALIAHHAGLRSMGVLAVVGIGLALVVAVVFLPSVVTLQEAGRSEKGKPL